MRDMNFVRSCLPALEEGVGILHQNHTRQQFDQILEWISSTNFPAQQSDFIARRQEGTGEWFLTSTEFTKWFQTLRDTLYCPGIPGSRPSLEEIFTTLQSIIRNYSSVYLILDALDECSYQDGTRGWLLAKFHELQKDVDLRIMVTSRFIHDMGKEFKSAARLEIRANDSDVRRFIEGQIDRLPNCVKRDEVLQEFVKDRIVEAVDGM